MEQLFFENSGHIWHYYSSKPEQYQVFLWLIEDMGIHIFDYPEKYLGIRLHILMAEKKTMINLPKSDD